MFLFPLFFPLKARLFDLSLITFKHHKDFDCSSPSYIFPILNRQESNSLLFLMSSRLSPTRQLSPLRIFLSGSCSRDSKESRPHTFVYIVAVFTSFFFFIQVFLSKHSGRRRRIGRNISKGDRTDRQTESLRRKGNVGTRILLDLYQRTPESPAPTAMVKMNN